MRQDRIPYTRVLSFALTSPWAVLDEVADVIAGVLSDRVAGVRYDEAEIAARLAGSRARDDARVGAGDFALPLLEAAERAPYAMHGSVAMIPVYGTIIPRADAFSEMSGATSTEALVSKLRAAAADPAVSRVLLDIDSPGGNVFGVEEAAAEIRETATQKPVVAVANFLAASAAYWLGSQATEFIVSPSGMVGSIGVVSLHENLAGALEQKGIEVTVMTAGKYKAEGHPFGPLAEEARGDWQARLDRYYGAFVAGVARGRNTTEAAVRSGFGQGRVVGAEEAVRLGMVDRVGTFSQALARAANPRVRLGRSAAAELDAWERGETGAPEGGLSEGPASALAVTDVVAALREQLQEVKR